MSEVTTITTNNLLAALHLDMPFCLRRVHDKGSRKGHGVYLPPGHLQRFATMHAIALIEHLEALAIREEMMREEAERLRGRIGTRRVTLECLQRAPANDAKLSDIVGRMEVAL